MFPNVLLRGPSTEWRCAASGLILILRRACNHMWIKTARRVPSCLPGTCRSCHLHQLLHQRLPSVASAALAPPLTQQSPRLLAQLLHSRQLRMQPPGAHYSVQNLSGQHPFQRAGTASPSERHSPRQQPLGEGELDPVEAQHAAVEAASSLVAGTQAAAEVRPVLHVASSSSAAVVAPCTAVVVVLHIREPAAADAMQRRELASKLLVPIAPLSSFWAM